jgi:DNA-binding MarR family transcriptional regulator
MAKSFDFGVAPAHLIRRAHQVAAALFMEEAADFGVTPVQFAMLNALMDDPGLDQVSLASRVAFDPATSGSVIGRLESKGWIRREADGQDRRRKRLWITPEGQTVAQQMKRAAHKTQERLVGPLGESERDELVRLLAKLVAAHEGLAKPDKG